MKRLLILVLFAFTANILFAQNSPKSKHKKEHERTAKTLYTCPMHPEVRSSKPGNCVKCGMRLIKAKSITYTCPMHPEVVRDKPGNCPSCGMALEQKKEDAIKKKG